MSSTTTHAALAAPQLSQVIAQFDQYVAPTYGRFPVCFTHGSGSFLWDTENRQYLDFGAGIAVCCLGHAPPQITRALDQQSRTLLHISNLFYNIPQGQLAEKLVNCVGSPGKIFFCNSGAEANEVSYKIARRFGHHLPGPNGPRHEIITFLDSFHGRTMGGISATGQEKVKTGFGPLLPGFIHLPYNNLQSVRDAINPLTVAILLEPIQGEGGVNPATPEFLLGLRELCDQNNLLLMLDEVQCGLGRTGHWCAWHTIGLPDLIPDTVSWAKGIAGGFPLGATWISDRPLTLPDGQQTTLPSLLGPGSHGTTYGGSPLSSAIGLAVLNAIEDEQLLTNAELLGHHLRRGLAQNPPPHLLSVRGLGLMIGLELDPHLLHRLPPQDQAKLPPTETPASYLVKQLLQAGLVVIPSGKNILRLLPPLNITPGEADQAIAILHQVLTQIPLPPAP